MHLSSLGYYYYILKVFCSSYYEDEILFLDVSVAGVQPLPTMPFSATLIPDLI